MNRDVSQYFSKWKNQENRKPLVLRGARQVGKSFAVRKFGKAEFKHMLEINFEQFPAYSTLFNSQDPKKILSLLETQFSIPLQTGNTLIFLDEVQAKPEIIPTLRYFYEQMEKIPIIAAGSLIDFALDKIETPMPVGRIEYCFMAPMSFLEFLNSCGEKNLAEFLHHYQLKDDFPEAIHLKLSDLLRTYFITGGMPESVNYYIKNKSFLETNRILTSLIHTYRDDFGKYHQRVPIEQIRTVFDKLPNQVCKKLKYVNISRDLKAREVARAIELLEKAKIIQRISHSSCSGIPLSAQENSSIAKLLYLDIGLLNSFLGIPPTTLSNEKELVSIHEGIMAEQFIGQELLNLFPCYTEPKLHYWIREQKNSSAEVDYVIQIDNQIVPIEVKSGKSGTMRSLHSFLEDKKRTTAVRFNSEPPQLTPLKTVSGKHSYQLLSLPLYMCSEVKRLARNLL